MEGAFDSETQAGIANEVVVRVAKPYLYYQPPEGTMMLEDVETVATAVTILDPVLN